MWGEWTLWPSQFSSQTDNEHCKMVAVFKVTDTWKMRSEIQSFCKIQNKAVVWFSQWYNLANIQNPVSKCCNTVMLTFLINFHKTANRNLVVILVEVFYFLKPAKPVGWAHALTMRSHISLVTQKTQNFAASSLISMIWFASIRYFSG